jgi:hypothetical protein
MRDLFEALRRRTVKLSLRESCPAMTPDPDRAGLAVVGIVKNEASYLAEWLEFHLMVGAGHIYLYDNGSTDGSQEVVKPFREAGDVTVIDWPTVRGRSPQVSAYADAIRRFGSRWRWMAFIDVDEFLYPLEGESLPALLDERYGHLAGLEVRWRNFGSGGHKVRPPGPVIAAFTLRGAGPACETSTVANVKSIVDPAAVSAVSGAHRFPFRRGERLRLPLEDEAIRLNHYFVRSREEFEKKLAVGSVYWGGVLDVRRKHNNRRLRMAQAIEESPVLDTAILRFVPELERRLARRNRSHAA